MLPSEVLYIFYENRGCRSLLELIRAKKQVRFYFRELTLEHGAPVHCIERGSTLRRKAHETECRFEVSSHLNPRETKHKLLYECI